MRYVFFIIYYLLACIQLSFNLKEKMSTSSKFKETDSGKA